MKWADCTIAGLLLVLSMVLVAMAFTTSPVNPALSLAIAAYFSIAALRAITT